LAVFLPFIFLGLVEVGLRLAGFGYDPAFFLATTDRNGARVLVENDRFSLRFFPPELARWPGTLKLAAPKPPDVQRIFVFGESAAMGDPQPSVGASRFLEVLLRDKFPGQRFEIINLGITAINSHVILPIAKDVAARGQGDFWLIYMGNNEMVGPFGAATVFGSRAPPLAAVRFNLAMQRTRLGQLLVAAKRKWTERPAGATWGGMKMFLQNQIPPNDPRRETVHQNFDRNLRDIVALGRNSGAKIVLSTMSVNLRDCPPFSSIADSNLPAVDRARFELLYAEALSMQTNHQTAAAVQKFADAAQIEPNFAELQFRRAQCLLNETNLAAAREYFQLACDVDALPFRADTHINDSIRKLAKELVGTNFAFCDAETALAQAASDGIAGDESFFEHVHFNFDGNYRLARVWAESIAKLLPKELQHHAAEAWAAQSYCERNIGLSAWNRLFVYSAVLGRMDQPPLAAQFNNPERRALLQGEMAELRERLGQMNTLAEAKAGFAVALAAAPEDAFLHENYANFLEATGDNRGALSEYLKIVQLLPHDFYGNLQSGRLLRESGRLAEAEPLLRLAAEQRPSLPEPCYELGKLVMTRGNSTEALDWFERALHMKPSDGSYLAFKARALSNLNRHLEAIEVYHQALELYAESWEGHFELAGELAAVNEVAESIREYEETIRLNPRHAVARVNLGVMLVRQNRFDEAVQQFESALQIDPSNAAAKDYLLQVNARASRQR